MRNQRGALLVEALIAITLFGMFAAASYLTLLTGQESTETGAQRVRGVYYTEQALEVTKAIRDRGFSNLSSGQFGYTIDSNGDWVLSGSTLERYGFNTYIDVDVKSSTSATLIARSSWKHGYHRSGSTLLSMDISNWRDKVGVGDWSSVTETGSILFAGGAVNFNDLVTYKNYLYLTSNVPSGDGLYIYDVSDPTSPTRVSNAFSLVDNAHDPVVYKDKLYVVVEDTDEVQMYDISDPTALNGSTTATATANLAGGSDRAISMTRYGNTLYVGAAGNVLQSELYAYGITGSTLIPLGELDLLAAGNPDILDIYVRENTAYLATGDNALELIVVDVSDPASMTTINTWNAFGSEDAYAVFESFSQTGYYLGKEEGAGNEFVMVTGSGGQQDSDPEFGYGVNITGDVNALTLDPLGCFAFMATTNTNQLQIASADSKNPSIVATDTEITGEGRGIHYDFINDLLFMATQTGVHIYSPGATTDCI